MELVGVPITTVWICLGAVVFMIFETTVPKLLLLICRDNDLVEDVGRLVFEVIDRLIDNFID